MLIKCVFIIGTFVVGLGAAVFLTPHFTTDTYLPHDDVVDGNVCLDRNGKYEESVNKISRRYAARFHVPCICHGS